jgi:hypothetical protein
VMVLFSKDAINPIEKITKIPTKTNISFFIY